jgi:hypothetical protein
MGSHMLRLMMFLLLYYAPAIYAGQCELSSSLDLCTLDAHIEQYKERKLCIKAFIGETYENAFLYDPKCQGGEPLMHFILKPKISGKINELREIMAKKDYAFVVVEGIVHGPEPIQIDPKLPDRAKELYKGSMKGYGHFGAYKMEIEIEKVIEAKEMDDGL